MIPKIFKMIEDYHLPILCVLIYLLYQCESNNKDVENFTSIENCECPSILSNIRCQNLCRWC